MSQHSILAPSAAERWFNCSGSVQLIAQLSPEKGSKYANQGSAAHEIAAKILTGAGVAGGKVEYDGDTFVITEYDDNDDSVSLSCVREYTGYIEDLIKRHQLDRDTQVKIEWRVKLHGTDANGEERFGTTDAALLIPSEQGIELVVVDLKYGKGVDVEAHNNLQGLDYILGIYESLSEPVRNAIYTARFAIVQPRAVDGRIVKEAWYTPEQIQSYAKALDLAIQQVFQNPILVAGSWCKKTFCSARGVCPALKAHTEETTGHKYDLAVLQQAPQLPAPEQMTPEQLAFILPRLDIMEDWANEIRKVALTQARHGTAIPNHKIVRKVTHRKFKNDDDVIKEFGAHYKERLYTDPKLISPNQLEQLIRQDSGCSVKKAKEHVASFTFKPDGEEILVHESDKRPAVPTNGEAYQAIIDAEVVSNAKD